MYSAAIRLAIRAAILGLGWEKTTVVISVKRCGRIRRFSYRMPVALGASPDRDL